MCRVYADFAVHEDPTFSSVLSYMEKVVVSSFQVYVGLMNPFKIYRYFPLLFISPPDLKTKRLRSPPLHEANVLRCLYITELVGQLEADQQHLSAIHHSHFSYCFNAIYQFPPDPVTYIQNIERRAVASTLELSLCYSNTKRLGNR